MRRYFNTTGPCVAGQHYLLPASDRCREILGLIERHQYFIIHAARQSGKTTLLLELRAALEAAGHHRALYCSLEGLQGIPEPREGIPAVIDRLRLAVARTPCLAPVGAELPTDRARYTILLNETASTLAARADRPLVMLFDEVDCLSEGTLISFLRQLRDGYVTRAQGVPFPVSCALVGMRNIRDYKARVRPERDTLGSASPFNIAAAALTLPNFTEAEVGALYGQHTADTGQAFPPEAVARAFWWSRGQPWLVNALALEVVDRMLERDYARPVKAAHFDEAAERLILRRDTHLDSLIERLREERVRRVIEPVLMGDARQFDPLDDDPRYVLDLGLLVRDGDRLRPANPIYAEVIPRMLTWRTQAELGFLPQPPAPSLYRDAAGHLDMSRLLQAFQQFWRENAEAWSERFEYKEAGPHLMLMAFLQRVVNGGGRVDREYALGLRRVDLMVHFEGQAFPVEIKVRSDRDPEPEGIEQLSAYMATAGAREGWLVLFDRRPGIAWDERIFWRTLERAGRTIHAAGC